MSKFTVLEPLSHDGDFYLETDEIELKDKDAKSLMAAGVIKPAEPKAEAKGKQGKGAE